MSEKDEHKSGRSLLTSRPTCANKSVRSSGVRLSRRSGRVVLRPIWMSAPVLNVENRLATHRLKAFVIDSLVGRRKVGKRDSFNHHPPRSACDGHLPFAMG